MLHKSGDKTASYLKNSWGERSGMHNTCENKQLWKDTTRTTTSETFKLQHTLNKEEIG